MKPLWFHYLWSNHQGTVLRISVLFGLPGIAALALTLYGCFMRRRVRPVVLCGLPGIAALALALYGWLLSTKDEEILPLSGGHSHHHYLNICCTSGLWHVLWVRHKIIMFFGCSCGVFLFLFLLLFLFLFLFSFLFLFLYIIFFSSLCCYQNT